MIDTAIDTVLREFGHDWVYAPGNKSIIRVAGPDPLAAMVIERDNGYVCCYLWSRVTGNRLGSLTVNVTNVEKKLLHTLTLFHTWRELSGDCCRLPRELHQSELGVVGKCATCGKTVVVCREESTVYPIADGAIQ